MFGVGFVKSTTRTAILVQAGQVNKKKQRIFEVCPTQGGDSPGGSPIRRHLYLHKDRVACSLKACAMYVGARCGWCR
jgi:hypothetical protein